MTSRCSRWRSGSNGSSRACTPGCGGGAPAAVAATSSSSMAPATHVASSRLASSGSSALTTPPAPRWAEKVPSGSRVNRNGPRLETTIIRRSAERAEEGEPVFELSGREEVLPHVLLAAHAHGIGLLRVGEELDGAGRAFLDRVDEEPVLTVPDLQDDAAGTAPDDRSGLPEPLGHGEPEAFP